MVKMKRVALGHMQSLGTESKFDGNKAGCACVGSMAVARSYNRGPYYCVGYCGNNGDAVRESTMNVAKYM